MTRRILLAALLAIPAAYAQSVAGLWDATILLNGVEIPFRMEFAGSGSDLQGWFFNGDEKVNSTAGRLERGSLVLEFAYYNSRLSAVVKDGQLEGAYVRDTRTYPFHARRSAPGGAKASGVPSIDGLWEVAVGSSKDEAAWHLIVKQSGPDVSAAILRVDGDTGTLSGSWRDGRFVLSHFSGARPLLLEITPQPDGSLTILRNKQDRWTALRPAAARAKGLPAPVDPAQHTRMKDPAEKFHFRFPDLSGKIISDEDQRFRNKVVIVSIGGSWCPNCHDEAPFLEELYRKYRARGLEVVELSFEEADQLKDPARLRAFIQRYGIEYPVLLAGETNELNAKVPQALHLNAWPTTFFLGRDGRVRAVHAGFAGRATGIFHDRLTGDVEALVEKLLAENTL